MRFTLLSLSILCFSMGFAQGSVSLDSCRNMALRNNKEMRIANEKVQQSVYQNKEAQAAYLPSLDFTGSYMYNQKQLSVFDSDQLLPTKNFNLATGKYDYNLVINPVTGKPLQLPD